MRILNLSLQNSSDNSMSVDRSKSQLFLHLARTDIFIAASGLPLSSSPLITEAKVKARADRLELWGQAVTSGLVLANDSYDSTV